MSDHEHEHGHDHDHDHDEEHEVLDLDEVLEDAPPEVREMVALSMGFAASLAAQNEILAHQRESVLQIAASAVEVAQDVLDWEDEDGQDDVEEVVETTVQHLKDAGAQFEESARAALALLQGQTSAVEQLGQPEAGGDFRSQALATVYQATAQALANAVQNTVAAQQQLNVLAQATLAQAADLLLSLVEEEEDDEDDDEAV
jgi:Killing trait